MPSIDQEQMLPVGTILDHRYQIVRYLASGGFGNTYLADDTRLGDYVAIKEFFMEGVNHRSGDRTTVEVSNTRNKSAFGEQLEKFKREAYRIFKLRNEHIIHVSDLFDANGTSYYVIDYIQGTSLDKQAATRPLSEAEARDAILQVLDALRDMHAQGIYHLDVKPGNIMRDSTGHCTLIDFGASKQLTRNERSTLATSVMPYTPGYAPLEQVGQLSNNIGPWTDFYALGATLYYLLTGQQPPEVDTYDIAPDGRNFPYPANVSATMRRAVSAMMNPKHDLRPQNADEVQALIDGDAMRTSPSKEDSQEPEMKEKKSGERVVAPLINKDVPSKPQNHPEDDKSKTNKSNKRKYLPVIYGLCLFAIVFFGWWFFFGKRYWNPQEQYELGNKYYKGEGVAPDSVEAVKWYQKAAEQGNDSAQFMLGKCYYEGHGVAPDSVEAVKWYQKAAEQGNAEAQYIMGQCYHRGHGVTQDYNEAVKWYKKAAEQGNADAQFGLGICYHDGLGVPQDHAEGVKWFRKSAEQGSTNAQCGLGFCYENGDGVAKDINEAVKLYMKAAEQGNAPAQDMLGDCYYSGQGFKRDYNEAVKWYMKAAEQGNDYAQNSLGDCYYFGQGVKKDYKEAVNWYRKAAEQGHADAQYNLGYCYENGEGVAKNKVEAKNWYKKAAAQGQKDAKDALKRL